MGQFVITPVYRKPISPRRFVERFGIRKIVCCFSGGMDSLVCTHYTFSSVPKHVEKEVVWVDTGVMIPPVRRYVRSVCRKFGWELTELKPEKSFEEYALRFGMPTMFRRWCSYYLKIRPIAYYVRKFERAAEVIGIRRDESRRRTRYPPVFKRMGSLVYAPILYWTRKDVEAYFKKHRLPEPPWYALGVKETCQCGAFASLRTMRIICSRYPNFFKKFLKLENKFRNGGACFFLNGKPCYAREIWEEVTKCKKTLDR